MKPFDLSVVSAPAGPDGFVARTWPFSDFLFEVRRPPPEWTADATGAECLHFSGIAQVKDRIYASAEALSAALKDGRITPGDITDGIGFYTAVVRDGGAILFLNDLLGLEHIYVYEGPGGPIVSNRLHALALHLGRAGVERKPNLIYAATQLSSHHPLFRQAHAHGLLVEGLSLVPIDHYVVVTGGRVERRRKPLIAAVFDGATGGASYSSLIDDAAEELLRNVRTVRESGLFDQISIDLSGGRDSRIIFGSVVRLGQLSETPVNIRDESGTDDLRCALRITRYYGAPLFTGDGHSEVAQDERFALALWRSYFAGMYHKLRGVPWSALGSNVRSLRFTGYCGEIYRSFWGNWFPDQLNAERTAMEGLGMVFDRVAPDFPRKHRDEAVTAFAATIMELPGGSVRQKLDNHYLFFRNRTHFGMRAFHVFNQFVRWPALISPSLLRASRMLPEDLGRKGKAMFDVLDRIAPELNFFPYASGKPWPEEIARASPNYGRVKQLARKAPDDFDRSPWEAAQAAVSRSIGEMRQRADRVFTPQEFKRYARSETLAGIAAIRRDLPELAALLGDDYGERTERLFEMKDEWPWKVATSKVGAVVDLLLSGAPGRA
jgi:hypothetical protein